MLNPKSFYDEQYKSSEYAFGIEKRKEEKDLKTFIEKFNLKDKKVLEVSCGRGAFQDLVSDYTGVDVTESLKGYIKKPYFVTEAESLPFPNNTFDAIWTITILEHVDDPEKALCEILRVLKPGGAAYLAPAWHCRDWAADGYEVRPYSNFLFKGKLIKASIPLRNNIFSRAAYILLFRLFREVQYLFFGKRPTRFPYTKLKPNYEKYWVTDSDATCSMDRHEMIL